jgi:hypothetical protein
MEGVVLVARRTMAVMDDAMMPLLLAVRNATGAVDAATTAALHELQQAIARAPYGPQGLLALCRGLESQLGVLTRHVLAPLPPGVNVVHTAQELQTAMAPSGYPAALFLFADSPVGPADGSGVPSFGALARTTVEAAHRDQHNLVVEAARLGAALGWVLFQHHSHHIHCSPSPVPPTNTHTLVQCQ